MWNTGQPTRGTDYDGTGHTTRGYCSHPPVATSRSSTNSRPGGSARLSFTKASTVSLTRRPPEPTKAGPDVDTTITVLVRFAGMDKLSPTVLPVIVAPPELKTLTPFSAALAYSPQLPYALAAKLSGQLIGLAVVFFTRNSAVTTFPSVEEYLQPRVGQHQRVLAGISLLREECPQHFLVGAHHRRDPIRVSPGGRVHSAEERGVVVE